MSVTDDFTQQFRDARAGNETALNALIGATTNDQVGFFSTCLTVALSNGNYVVATPLWDNGALANVGSVT